MIRRLKSGKYRLYSRKKDPKTGKRRNLRTFRSLEAAKKVLPQLWAGDDWRRDIVFSVNWYEDNAPNPARGVPKEGGDSSESK